LYKQYVKLKKKQRMWTKSHSMVTKEVTKEQMWKLFADVNNWHTWDAGIEYAKMEGKFERGNRFELKPKGGPKVKIELVEIIENKKFVDLTKFPLAKMYGEHTFEETPNGLKITTTMKVEGPLSFLWVKLVAKDIVDHLPQEIPEQVKFASKLPRT
jgi:Polyketide cyclase / dehydrase and lipid transport